MVYVDNKKFACESCIKGHRSSSCHHTDRPLFEIKKKGRPVSQCEKCRELRQSKRVHSKCTCVPKDTPAPMSAATSGKKSRRFIPIVPALPNGLRDALAQSTRESSTSSDVRQRVDSLLNPCSCKSITKCKCSGHHQQELALATLARAAAAISVNQAAEVSTPSPIPTYSDPSPRSESFKRPPSPHHSPRSHSNKRAKLHSHHPYPPSPGPNLPPLLITDDLPYIPALNKPMPEFPVMPPMSTISSIAGSGCTCGLLCACPGCVEHRGPGHVATDRKDCTDGCGTCVDPDLGVLPGHDANTLDSFNSKAMTSMLQEFFARAASLPPPPVHRRIGATGIGLDPTNSIVYPEIARETTEHATAFGLISVPKLECCRGQCGCPHGRCTCNNSCDGCCADHVGDEKTKPDRHNRHQQLQSEVSRGPFSSLLSNVASLPSLSMTVTSSPVPSRRSCCAGKPQ